VDLIRAYSNKAYLREQYADLRKRLQALPIRSLQPARVGRTRRLKRRLDNVEIDQIISKYQAGISTNQHISEHHLAKRTISALVKANGVTIRRQGLRDQEAREAVTLYRSGRSLAWIANHFGGLSPRPLPERSDGRAFRFARGRALRDAGRCKNQRHGIMAGPTDSQSQHPTPSSPSAQAASSGSVQPVRDAQPEHRQTRTTRQRETNRPKGTSGPKQENKSDRCRRWHCHCNCSCIWRRYGKP
jgi:hypothetical protein